MFKNLTSTDGSRLSAKLAKNTLIISLPSVLVIPVTLISVPILLDKLGTELLGELILINTLFYLSQIILFGTDKVLSRILIEKQFSYHFWSIFIFSFLPFFAFLIVLFGICTFVIDIGNIYKVSVLSLTLVFIGLAQQMFFQILRATLIALRKFTAIATLTLNLTFIFYLSPLFVVMALHADASLETHLLVICIVRVILMVAIFIYCSHAYQSQQNEKGARILKFRELLKGGTWIGICNICTLSSENLDKLVVGNLFGSASIVAYSIPLQVSQKVAVIPISFTSAVYPEKSAKKELKFQREFSLVTYFLLVAISLIIPFSEDIFHLWLNTQTQKLNIDVFKIGMVSFSLYGLNSILTSFLEIDGRSKGLAYCDVILTCFLFLFVILLGNEIGLTGIAIAVLVKEMFSFIFRLFFSKLPMTFSIRDWGCVCMFFSCAALVNWNIFSNPKIYPYFIFLFLATLAYKNELLTMSKYALKRSRVF